MVLESKKSDFETLSEGLKGSVSHAGWEKPWRCRRFLRLWKDFKI